ncbi:aspartate/glutamate racemase family protein [Cloacibacillus evryensis]|uniref:aspartate/glutamate racemase family protein n=2 Tax=Cloacibacillus evryensis TaxID=508460 RepID=UPI00210B7815|nr:amino acid racemase [Cloacibacillus evryensis]MCQ4763024.1 amino acid racemase [Cloacibacillus evryensis]
MSAGTARDSLSNKAMCGDKVKEMKTIGIIGGVAWPSTVTYYRTINEEVAKRLGGNGLHCAKLVLAQTDFEEIERNQVLGNWERIGGLLAGEANKLKAAGADFFIIACNTVHTAIQYVEARTDLPYIHIVDPAAKMVVDGGYKRVGLLGSGYTMKGTYFTGRLKERYGLDVLLPEGEHEQNVHNALYLELTKGILLPETRARFKAAIEDLAHRGAQAVILGCTEFGMVAKQEDSPIPLIDTTVAHALAAVERALKID